jgi:hypothetical protein
VEFKRYREHWKALCLLIVGCVFWIMIMHSVGRFKYFGFHIVSIFRGVNPEDRSRHCHAVEKFGRKKCCMSCHYVSVCIVKPVLLRFIKQRFTERVI